MTKVLNLTKCSKFLGIKGNLKGIGGLEKKKKTSQIYPLKMLSNISHDPYIWNELVNIIVKEKKYSLYFLKHFSYRWRQSPAETNGNVSEKSRRRRYKTQRCSGEWAVPPPSHGCFSLSSPLIHNIYDFSVLMPKFSVGFLCPQSSVCRSTAEEREARATVSTPFLWFSFFKKNYIYFMSKLLILI